MSSHYSCIKKKKKCVVNCLKEYITKTEDIRNGNDQLFLSYVKPHGPASKDIVSRWMKSVLVQAGIKCFEPYSFQGAAASAMAKSGMTLEDILKKAGWTNAATFKKFYYRTVPNDRVHKADTKITKYLVKNN